MSRRTAAHLNRLRGVAAPLAIALVLLAPGAALAVPRPAWIAYDRDAARSGVDPDSSIAVAPTFAWDSPTLDGPIYGQPLVLGGRVYVATENDTVYALDAATGHIIWQSSVPANLGQPVPGTSPPLPTPPGDIRTVGITGTPVIDPATSAIYAVAYVWDGSTQSSVRHLLLAYDLATGAPLPGFPVAVDPPRMVPWAQLQRTALALDGREIVIGYGGHAGDSGPYTGWLVAVRDDGRPPQLSYQIPTTTGGAVWGGGSGPVLDAAGNLYVATGNSASTDYGNYDEGNSVLKFDPNLKLLDHFAPSTWVFDNANDLDLGSTEPVLLPDGLLFQSGKSGTGYLLSSSSLGGAAANSSDERSLFHGTVCPSDQAGGGVFGGAVYYGGRIYAPCRDGVRSLTLNASDPAHPSFSASAGWQLTANALGPPIVSGGRVWSLDANPDSKDSGTLYGLDPATGAVRFTYSTTGDPNSFTSPSAAGGRLFVPTGEGVTAFQIGQLPQPVVSITSPATGTTVPAPTVSLTGTVSDTVDITSLTVNGAPAQAGADGAWTATVSGLSPGTNKLVAVATDGAGVSGQATVTVTYTQATPATGVSVGLAPGSIVGTTPSTTLPPPSPPVTKAPLAITTSLSHRLNAVSGRVRVRLRCAAPLGRRCRGAVLLRLALRIPGHGRLVRYELLTIGSASFALAGGASTTVTLSLTDLGRRILDRHRGGLHARLVVHTGVSGNGTVSSSSVLLRSGA